MIKGLETLIKDYAPLAAFTALQTPLHEGLHAGLAKALPHTSCSGVVLEAGRWYNPVFSTITLGFYESEKLPPGLAGYAKLAIQPDFLGHVSGAISAAGPEVATMALGFYWIKRAMNNIKESGQRIYSLTNGIAGMTFAASSYYYLTSSVLSPQEGSDHKIFTEQMLQAAHLPGEAAPILTSIGAGVILGAALYIANLLPGAGAGERSIWSRKSKNI
jgi:hypothetical protein